MSKLNDLIAELCPNGVEQKHLWEVTIWNKRFNAVNKIKQPKILSYPNILASELFSLECPNGNVCLLSAGEYIGWTTEDLAGDNLCEGEIIAIPSGQGGATIKNTIKYYNGKFVTSGNNIATSFDTTVLLNKYLYYWLINCADMIYTLYNGPQIKHPDMNHILDLKIPIPPLPIQEYIVHILDNFTKLISDINAEINLRKQQYEYYRDKLFTFDDSIPIVTLGEISTIVKGHNLVKSDIIDNGVGCIHYGEIYTYYDTYATKTISYVSPEMAKNLVVVHNSDLIITVTGENVRDICKCVAWLGEDDIVIGDHTAVIRHNQNPKYLSYWFQTIDFNKQKHKIAQGANVIDVPIAKIKEIKIPLPSIEKQNYIADILDNFTTLISDLENEIDLRKQQYEYYMGKLFTFDNLQEPTIHCLKNDEYSYKKTITKVYNLKLFEN